MMISIYVSVIWGQKDESNVQKKNSVWNFIGRGREVYWYNCCSFSIVLVSISLFVLIKVETKTNMIVDMWLKLINAWSCVMMTVSKIEKIHAFVSIIWNNRNRMRNVELILKFHI